MLTAQARTAAIARWAAYVDNPAAFAYDILGFEADDYQREVLEAVAAGKDVTWRSGHGVGKTATLAILVFFFLLTRPFSKIPTTAPTMRQVKDVLWAEITRWYQRCRVRDQLTLQTTKLAVKARPAEWFAIGVASNKPQNMEGFHAARILFIVDEAKGVSDPIFDAIDGALTTGGQRIYASTPGSRAGKFYDSHFGRIARFYSRHHTNGERCSRVSRAWLDTKREEWGEDSPIYQAKVRGEFPQEGDDILIKLAHLDAAEDAFDEATESGQALVGHTGARVGGADIANLGFDETVFCAGSISRIDHLAAWHKEELEQTAARIIAFARPGRTWSTLPAGGLELVGIDETGLGAGVSAMLRNAEIRALKVVLGGKEGFSEEDRVHYANLKAKMAVGFARHLAANFEARQKGGPGTFALLKDERMKGQLANLRIRPSQRGEIRLLDPDDPEIPASEIPKGLRVSPDRAHAALICYHTATVAASHNAVGVLKPPDSAATRQETQRQRILERRRMSAYILGRRRSALVEDGGD